MLPLHFHPRDATTSAPAAAMPRRHHWQKHAIEAPFALPFADLIARAQAAHRAYFDANEVQLSTLLSSKTGPCLEDCAYCPQGVRCAIGVEREALLPP